MFFVAPTGTTMEVLERCKLKKQMDTMKQDASKRNLLCRFLKYEIQSLVQRLADYGEESVVVTANVVDGSHTVLASDHGENFLHNKVVSHFMDHFIRYLIKGQSCHGKIATECQGRGASPDTDVDSAGEMCLLKTEQCPDSLNLKVNEEFYTAPPETFMHMKKHQIEQYNRRKDSEDRTIDDEVSKLVKNILKEGKEKEKLRTYPSVPCRRKRGCSSQGESQNSRCSSPKRLPISELFPTLTPMLSKKPIYTSSFDSQSEHSESERTLDEFVVIKSEPVDDGEYGGVMTSTNVTDSINQYDVGEGNSCTSSYIAENSQQGDVGEDDSCTIHIVDNHNILDDSSELNGVDCTVTVNTSIGSQTCDLSDNSDGNHDEVIDLPFVEPFYKDREKCMEDVKLTPQEICSKSMVKLEKLSTISPVSCYKQSKKKSNIFNLVLNGYSYIRDKQGNGGTIYWKCGRTGCRGRVIQRDQDLIISQRHCHDPTTTLPWKRKKNRKKRKF